MTEERRRIIRKISSVIKPEEQKAVWPVEESSAEGRTNESRRRSRRKITSAESEEPKASVPAEESLNKTEREEVTNQVTSKGILVMRRDLDEISSELREERNSALVESNYWDETHSWGSDDEEGSDEYWHFLGRYE